MVAPASARRYVRGWKSSRRATKLPHGLEYICGTVDWAHLPVLTLVVGQSRGQLEGLVFQRKCNGPNGLSRDLTHIQNLESYRWTISHPRRGKKRIAARSR